MAFGIPGTENMNLPNVSGLMSGLGQFIILLFMFILVGGIFYGIYYVKKKKKNYNKKIFWFEEVNGSMIPIGTDNACELIIPGTNINVFYIKEKGMYLPRPVKKMGKDAYWFVVRSNREIVNFVMKNINEEMTEANLDFDHTDQRYALTNLKDLIKRNYRDKSQPWWREYKDIIGLVILIFVLTLSFIFIISKVGGLIDRVGTLIDHADSLIKIAQTTSGSGVVTQ
jgi:hypothetical protein